VEIGAGQGGARGGPSPNAGKVVKVRWVKQYAEATNQVCIGEVVRETAEYLVMRGVVLNVRKGAPELKRDEERVHWIPWGQIAGACELPSDTKWRQLEFTVDEVGDVKCRRPPPRRTAAEAG